ncbi:MAG TPA: hypothetical protein VLJ12_06800 [Burkholderiales bacterium]|nr:hypothetical protein [Burkholderiales bacterium]
MRAVGLKPAPLSPRRGFFWPLARGADVERFNISFAGGICLFESVAGSFNNFAARPIHEHLK